MSKFRNAVAARDAHVFSLRMVIVLLALLCAGMWYGWQEARKELVIHNPPDLRSGSTRLASHIPPSSVYAFTYYIWQQLNRWEVDGKKDYKRKIAELRPFFTPLCREYLNNDYRTKNARLELSNRVRSVNELPLRGYKYNNVDIISSDEWRVDLYLMLNETLNGQEVKTVPINYPLIVKKRDIDPELNPWGLQIDCFDGKPLRININSKSE